MSYNKYQIIYRAVFAIVAAGLGGIGTSNAAAPAYPFSYEFTTDAEWRYDQNGIPYSTQKGYHPGVIARLALAHYGSYVRRRDQQQLTAGLRMADWLASHLDCSLRSASGQTFGVWWHNYPHPPYTDNSAWPSAMSNGLAIAALMSYRPHVQQPAAYDAAAACALSAFTVDVQEGGLATPLTATMAWYEEQAVSRRPMTLNGMVFALAGLWVADQSGLAGAGNLFERGSAGVLSMLPEFDLGYHSKYSLMGRPTGFPGAASDAYNHIHIRQLAWLYCATGNNKFRDYAVRFDQYSADRFNYLEINGIELLDGVLFDDAKFYGGTDMAARSDIAIGTLPARPRRLRLFLAGLRAPPAVMVRQDGAWQPLGEPQSRHTFMTDNYATQIYSWSIHPGFRYGSRVKFRVTAPVDYVMRQIEIDYDSKPKINALIAEKQGTGAWACVP